MSDIPTHVWIFGCFRGAHGHALQPATHGVPYAVSQACDATDPYVPIERSMRLTRGCLEVMVEHPPAALLLQTRSPLVARDVDLLRRIPTVRVSMTIATDDERVRRVFEPNAPATKLRIDALRLLHEAGVRTQAAIAPLLPCDADRLAALLDAVVDRVVVDDFFEGDGAGGRRSGAALTRLRELGYAAFAEPGYAEATLARLRERLGAARVLRSQAGFVP